MRTGGCRTRGGVFSNIPRGGPSSTQPHKRKEPVDSHSSPVRKSNRICGGQGTFESFGAKEGEIIHLEHKTQKGQFIGE